MCSKPRNEDKDNIDQDIEVCAIGVQTIMQSDHGTPCNQNKLKIQSYHDAFCSEFPKSWSTWGFNFLKWQVHDCDDHSFYWRNFLKSAVHNCDE